MKKTIWKFPLRIQDEQDVIMPIGAEILTVQTQDGTPCLWALVDPKAEKEARKIEIFGTGNPIYHDMSTQRKYISTFEISGGALIFHVFENLGL